MKGLVCRDYWPGLGLKQRQNLQPFWATCMQLSRTLLSSCLSHFLLVCLTFRDHVWRLLIKERKKKNLYPQGKIVENKCLPEIWLSSQCCESRWKWVKMPNNFKGFQTWGCLLNGDRTCGFIILFYVDIMSILWHYAGKTCVCSTYEIAWLRK